MTKTTQPLAKAITTLEGQLSVLLTVVLGAAGSPALHALNPKVAAIAIAVNNLALLAQRGLLKAKALQATPLGTEMLDSAHPGTAVLQALEVPTEAAVNAELP